MSNFYKEAPGWVITKQEREWLCKMAADTATRFPESVIVNIGVLHGATMHCLRAGSETVNLFGVDITYKHGVHRREELNATFIQGNSSICHVDFQSDIQMLFIDGDHHYNAVKGDIRGWASKVVVGGIISFHDYKPTERHLRGLPWLEGVKRAVDEWIKVEGHNWLLLETPDSICAFRRLNE